MIDQTVGDVMTRRVRTIPEGTTACDLARLFAEYEIGSAVVLADVTDEILGIVTESDVMGQVASGADVASVTVDSFMSSPVVTMDSSASIHEAASLMKEHSIQRLPVVDGDDLVGILTTTNLTHYIPRLQNAVRRTRGGLASQ